METEKLFAFRSMDGLEEHDTSLFGWGSYVGCLLVSRDGYTTCLRRLRSVLDFVGL